MLQYPDRGEAQTFLKEVRRVLRPGGTIRIAVPDLMRRIEKYKTDQNADELMESIFVCADKPRDFLLRPKPVLVGRRHQFWMYDASSLVALLYRHGFTDAKELPPGRTTIPDAGSLNQYEREEESTYVEAIKRNDGEIVS